MTAEIKKARYVYYHCTGGRGACGNTYVREEELSRLFADVVKHVQVPIDVAENPRTREKCSQSLYSAGSARTAFAENADIELHVRPRKSFSGLR